MQINWYLKGNTETEGPFSEPEIRARLLAGAYSPGAEVKQGESAWRPADEVKQLFVRIYQEGWYVRVNDKTVGPFVTQKLLDLHQAGKLPKKAMLRQGASTTWTPATEMIESLQQKQALLSQLNQTIKADSKPNENREGERVDIIHDDEVEVIVDGEMMIDGEVIEVQEAFVPPIPSRMQLSKPSTAVKPTVATPPAIPRVAQSSRPVTPTKVTSAAKPATPIPIAQVVVPGPSFVSNTDDLFRDIPSLQPVAMPSAPFVPNYSQPIAAPAYANYGPRSVNGYTAEQVSRFRQWFYWLIILAIAPRLILIPLGGLAYAFDFRIGLGIVGCIGLLEFFVCIAIMSAVGIWQIIIPFQESAEQGLLCLFIPFYGFYYLISRWDRCWPALLLYGGCAIWSLSIILVPLFVALLIR